MPILRISAVLLLVAALLCYIRTNRKNLIKEPDGADFKSIEQVIMKQQEDWNRGNLEVFMEGYWQDDSMRFVSPSGTRYGHKNTLEAYRKHYKDKAAMGTLSFRIDRIGPLSEGSDLAVASGRWEITGSPEAGSGYFSLILKKFNENWKIIADHTWADSIKAD